MQVKDVMVKDVKTIEAGFSVKDAAKKMTEFRVGSLIVTDSNGRMLGIITDRDILLTIVSGKRPQTKVDDVMTKNVYFVKPTDDIGDAVDIMIKNGIKKLPVIDKSALIGIITMTDIAAAEPKLLEQLSQLMLFGQKQKFVAG